MNEIVAAAGGARAHPDADRRLKPGADYLLGDTLIELKALDDEGLSKPERQRKIADLFRKYGDRRPVVVIDRNRLPESGQREFDGILDRPLNGIVKKARSQLVQSRSELDQATCSILMVLNNGYTALGHDALTELAAHRVRNDTREIDGVVVGGCYYHGDGFDSFFLWPLDYIPINANAPFHAFPELKRAWDAYAGRTMTALVRGELPLDVGKGPVLDTQFDFDGTTYVKPAPPMGRASEFYIHGRPRKGGSAVAGIPPVALTFPDMAAGEWIKFREVLPSDSLLCESYQEWRKQREKGFEAGTLLKPFVPMLVTREGWEEWCADNKHPRNASSVRRYANELFCGRLRVLLHAARERTHNSVVPTRYVLVITEEIGQDQANDLTRIGVVHAGIPEDEVVKELVLDTRISHEHGLALAGAYALAEGVDYVMWQKDARYAWT
ncbi:hypothetical protein [Lysobacter sp. Root983]|uniref:hypothetical protein n=1 Tax=Lysobacter sp. Root983 TaxID=1736613 RepID=UPI00070C1928|nr:hypothetical protein [Lysobacter sp. Root983]KRD79722.1 hypothetical protein ASE43_02140 [Lysobacter sp. Root983]